jgi:hypothetical protein
MENKLNNLLSEIATMSKEDVKTLFLEVSQFPAINAYLLAKMQELLANTFEDVRATLSDFIAHLSIRDAQNTMGTRGNPE